ncbi:MAG: hypothetical protein GX951_00845 [Mollicutes bacterium]|nr:hypothetical protein [Mollicutes bacterium]
MKKILKLIIVVLLTIPLVTLADTMPSFWQDELTAEIGNKDGAKVLKEQFCSSDIAIIPYGTKVAIESQKKDYVYVIYKGDRYCIKIENLKNPHYNNIWAQEKLVTRYLLADVTLRKGPSDLFEEVGFLKAETKVNCTSDSIHYTDGWAYITDGNISGYARNPNYDYVSNGQAFLGQKVENIPRYYAKAVTSHSYGEDWFEADKYSLDFFTPIDVRYIAETWKFGYGFFMKYKGKIVQLDPENVLEDYNYKITFKSFEYEKYPYEVFDLEGNKLNVEDIFELNKTYQIKYISGGSNFYIDVDGKIYILGYPTGVAKDQDIVIDYNKAEVKKEDLLEEETIKNKVIEESPDDITKKSVNNYIIKIGIPIISIVISAGIIIIFINKERKLIKETK